MVCKAGWCGLGGRVSGWCFESSVPWVVAQWKRVKSRAAVSRLFSNQETGQVASVLVWRRRAQERRGRILCGRGMTLKSQSSGRVAQKGLST